MIIDQSHATSARRPNMQLNTLDTKKQVALKENTLSSSLPDAQSNSVKQNTQSNDAKHKHTDSFKREHIIKLNQIVLNRTHNQIVVNTVKEAA